MKKLLLLDADVIIDLHSLGLFEKIGKAYEVQVTKAVLNELEKSFRECIKEGKALRILFKKLV